jgi:hypothetical protein
MTCIQLQSMLSKVSLFSKASGLKLEHKESSIGGISTKESFTKTMSQVQASIVLGPSISSGKGRLGPSGGEGSSILSHSQPLHRLQLGFLHTRF